MLNGPTLSSSDLSYFLIVNPDVVHGDKFGNLTSLSTESIPKTAFASRPCTNGRIVRAIVNALKIPALNRPSHLLSGTLLVNFVFVQFVPPTKILTEGNRRTRPPKFLTDKDEAILNLRTDTRLRIFLCSVPLTNNPSPPAPSTAVTIRKLPPVSLTVTKALNLSE